MNIKFENLEKIDELLKRMDKLEEKLFSTKRWLNIQETAHYLGYSKDHVHKLKNEHLIQGKHYHKQAGRILFDKGELDNWVTQEKNTLDVIDIANDVFKDLI